jgi:tRNA (mo5U34)-methyltransferase
MSDDAIATLQEIKARTWFYEFALPDGSHTSTDIPPEILLIHTSRRYKLLGIIRDCVEQPHKLTAADLASHEGYYSLELAKHFKSVHGYEIRRSSLEAARSITKLLGVQNVEYSQVDLQTASFDEAMAVDFVLLYGLIYHLENPVHTIRLASQMSRKHILVETQVFPYDVSGGLEDGHYTNMRRIEGVFGLTPDYSSRREGGSTDIALVPSLNALLFLLTTFGFTETMVLPSGPDDYEQFRRGSRVVVYGQKATAAKQS